MKETIGRRGLIRETQGALIMHTCPLCHEPVFSEFGKSCRLCGMHLQDESREFCSTPCRKKYFNINHHF